MKELVVLVDENDNKIGQAEKMEAHVGEGKLHRAFSIYAFNSKGELMLQKRALGKYHAGGLWTNTCCGHPRPGEDVEVAAHRRLIEEMGFDGPLEKKGTFIYKVKLNNGLSEYEYLHVFVVRCTENPKLNPEEAIDWKWMNVEDLDRDIKENPENYTKWFLKILPKVSQIYLLRREILKKLKNPNDLSG